MDASSMQLLTVKDAENIKAKAKYVAGVSPLVSGSGQAVAGANNWPTSIQGVGEDFLEIRKLKLAEGSVFSDHDVKVAAKVCIIGKTVVTNLFPNDPHPIGKTIRFNKIPLTVIGVLEEKGTNTFGQDQDNIMLAPYTTVQKRVLAINYVQSIYASAVSEADTELAVAEIESILRENPKLVSRECPSLMSAHKRR